MTDKPVRPCEASESTAQHRAAAANRAIECAVLTISDTRTKQTDRGGPLVCRFLQEAGHTITHRAICRDQPEEIAGHLDTWIADKTVQVILTTGGTGVGTRDSTIEIVAARLTARLDGFGELFRMLSWDVVGAAAMLSRACAGLVAANADDEGTFIFAMPGSPNAIEVAMSKLIVPELPHLVWERKR